MNGTDSYNESDDPGSENAFIVSSIKGDLHAVRALLKSNMNPNYLNKDDWSALMLATLESHKHVVEELINAKADVNIKDKRGVSAVSLAVQQGHFDIMTLLLNSKATIANAEHVYSLLSVAISMNHVAVVQSLLSLSTLYDSFDINLLDSSGSTLLHMACTSRLDHISTVSMLIRFKANVNQKDLRGTTPLICAVVNGSANILSLLLRERADVNMADEDGATALTIAAERGHITCINVILTCGADIHHRTTQGWTPLMYAVLNNHLPTAMLLISLGAHILAMPLQRVGPFDLARELKLTAMVQMMMVYAASVGSGETVPSKHTLAHTVITQHTDIPQHPAITQHIKHKEVHAVDGVRHVSSLERGGNKVGVHSQHNHNHNHNHKAVQPVVPHQSAVNQSEVNDSAPKAPLRRKLSRYPTMFADSSGDVYVYESQTRVLEEPVLVSLDQSTGPNRTFTHRLTPSILVSPTLHPDPLSFMQRSGDQRVGHVISNADAKLDDRINQKIRVLTDTSSSEGVSDRVETNTNVTGSDAGEAEPVNTCILQHRESCLGISYFEAIEDDNFNALRVLHSTNADINETNKDGFTPLMYACVLGRSQFVNILLSMKCDINAKDGFGLSALMHATRHRHDSIVYSLVVGGAAINGACSVGDTAMTIAESQKNTSLVAFFQQYLLRQSAENSSHASSWSSSSSKSRCLLRDESKMLKTEGSEQTVINYMLQTRTQHDGDDFDVAVTVDHDQNTDAHSLTHQMSAASTYSALKLAIPLKLFSTDVTEVPPPHTTLPHSYARSKTGCPVQSEHTTDSVTIVHPSNEQHASTNVHGSRLADTCNLVMDCSDTHQYSDCHRQPATRELVEDQPNENDTRRTKRQCLPQP